MTPRSYSIVYVGDTVELGANARVTLAPPGASHTVDGNRITLHSPGVHHVESVDGPAGLYVFHREVLQHPSLVRKHGDRGLQPNVRTSPTAWPHPCPGTGDAPMIPSAPIINDQGDAHGTTRGLDEMEGILRSLANHHGGAIAKTTPDKPLPPVSLQPFGADHGQ